MSQTSHTTQLTPPDGYILSAADGYGYQTDWVDFHAYTNLSVSIIFTGGSPSGIVKLLQSNDTQVTGPLVEPRWVANTQYVSDATDVPAGNGVNTATVSGPGIYILNQHQAGFRWFSVIYTPIVNSDTLLNIYAHIKGF